VTVRIRESERGVIVSAPGGCEVVVAGADGLKLLKVLARRYGVKLTPRRRATVVPGENGLEVTVFAGAGGSYHVPRRVMEEVLGAVRMRGAGNTITKAELARVIAESDADPALADATLIALIEGGVVTRTGTRHVIRDPVDYATLARRLRRRSQPAK